MPGARIGRINEEIRFELSSLIRTVKDPRVNSTMISITAVDTTHDLKYCKVFISTMDKDKTKDVMKGLKSASGYLRHALGQNLNLRNTPELTFIADNSIEEGAHILEMLRNPEIVKPENPANADIVLSED